MRGRAKPKVRRTQRGRGKLTNWAKKGSSAVKTAREKKYISKALNTALSSGLVPKKYVAGVAKAAETSAQLGFGFGYGRGGVAGDYAKTMRHHMAMRAQRGSGFTQAGNGRRR